MSEVKSASDRSELHLKANRLRSEMAFIRVVILGRQLRRSLLKYNPGQPRVPGGHPGGGRWTSVGVGGAGAGGGDAPASDGGAPGDDLGLPQDIIPDDSGDAPWSFVADTYADDGTLAAQIIENRNDTTTTTEWDTSGVERWAVRQTLTDADRTVVTTAEFNADTTARFSFGAGAAGKFELVNNAGEFELGRVADLAPGGTGWDPAPGSQLALFSPGIAIATETAGPGALAVAGPAGAIFIAGTVAFSTPAGATTFDSLGEDFRLSQADNGRPPFLESRVDGKWNRIDGAVSFGVDGNTLVVDTERLRAAVGDERTNAAIAALTERSRSTLVGERWTPDTGRSNGLAVRDVENACKMYTDYQASVEWAASAIDREGLTPSQYGTAVHTAVDRYFKANYAQFDPVTGTFDTEFSVRKDTKGAYYAANYGEAGSKRFDAYEDVGNGTVCGYDIKTSRAELSPSRIAELRAAAIGFYRTQNNDAYPREVYILQVRPWR